MTTHRPTRNLRRDVAAWTAYQCRHTSTVEAIARTVLATIIGVLLTVALVHWATPCAQAALCWAPLAMPQQQLRRLCRRLHMAVLRARLTQLLGAAQQAALDDAPALDLANLLVRAAGVRLALERLERAHRLDAWLARRA